VNLLLITNEDFLPDGTVRLSGRRAWHAREVLTRAERTVVAIGPEGGWIPFGVETFVPFVLGWLLAQPPLGRLALEIELPQ
jgi:hypothetical protein